MNRFRGPLMMNGWLIAAVFVIAGLNSISTNSGDALPFIMGSFMLLLAPVNLVVGMVRNRNKKPDGSAYILFAGLMLLIGFSVCGAGLAYGDINFH
jgi:hypothetical protein